MDSNFEQPKKELVFAREEKFVSSALIVYAGAGWIFLLFGNIFLSMAVIVFLYSLAHWTNFRFRTWKHLTFLGIIACLPYIGRLIKAQSIVSPKSPYVFNENRCYRTKSTEGIA